MPTPRFSDLSSSDALQVIDAFLGKETLAEFTEKIAGQNLVVLVRPNEVITTSKKHGDKPIRIFSEVREAIEAFHPKVSDEVRYTFEVLKKERPDFVDYVLSDAVYVIDIGGNLSSQIAESLNSSQDKVKFVTKNSITRPVAGAADDAQTETLQSFRSKLMSGQKISKQETAQIESVLSNLLDQGAFPSVFGGGRIEGLFGAVKGSKFKIPSKKYSDIQRLHSGLYASVLRSNKRDFVARFSSADASDKLVSDVRNYLEKVATTSLEPGFRTFFKPSEAKQLASLTNAQLAPIVYDRISSKKWVPTTAEGVRRTDDLLRQFIHECLSY